MTPDLHTTRPRAGRCRLRRGLALLGLLLFLPASGCCFFLDEFMWLDRQPESPAQAVDTTP